MKLLEFIQSWFPVLTGFDYKHLNNLNQITPLISFQEFTDSKDHPELVAKNRKIFIESSQLQTSAFKICSVLEHFRDIIDNKITKTTNNYLLFTVLSGFRYFRLNWAVGGSKFSRHKKAEAIDYFFPSVSTERVFNILLKYFSEHPEKIKFHKIIYYPRHNFLHTSLARPGKTNGQFIIKNHGRVYYWGPK